MRLTARQQLCSSLVGLLITFRAPVAHSQEPPRARLIFTSSLPRSCPGEAALRASVSARLGRRAWRPDAPRTIEVAMRTAKQSIKAEILLKNTAGRLLGRRVLEARGDECVELSAATALAISIAIDPLAPHAAPLSRPTRKPPPPSIARPAPRPTRQPAGSAGAPRPKKKATRQRAFSVAAALSTIVGLGATPKPAAGARLSVDIRWPRISLGLDLHLDLLPTFTRLTVGELSVWVASASANVCARRGYFFGCALFNAAWLRGEGHGLIGAKAANLPLFGLGARAGIELPIQAGWFVRAYGELLGALGHVTLIDSVTRAEFWRSSPVIGSLGIGVGVLFL